MNNFNYFFTPVGHEYKKKPARNVGVAVLILFAFYGIMSLISYVSEESIIESDDEVILEQPSSSTITTTDVVDFENITTMHPNNAELFYYPDPQDTENRDAFERF